MTHTSTCVHRSSTLPRRKCRKFKLKIIERRHSRQRRRCAETKKLPISTFAGEEHRPNFVGSRREGEELRPNYSRTLVRCSRLQLNILRDSKSAFKFSVSHRRCQRQFQPFSFEFFRNFNHFAAGDRCCVSVSAFYFAKSKFDGAFAQRRISIERRCGALLKSKKLSIFNFIAKRPVVARSQNQTKINQRNR